MSASERERFGHAPVHLARPLRHLDALLQELRNLRVGVETVGHAGDARPDFLQAFDGKRRFDLVGGVVGPADEAAQQACLEYAFDHLRITAVNDAMCRQMEQSREELVGSVPRVRWWRDPERWRDQFRLLFSQGHTHHSVTAPRRSNRERNRNEPYLCFI